MPVVFSRAPGRKLNYFPVLIFEPDNPGEPYPYRNWEHREIPFSSLALLHSCQYRKQSDGNPVWEPSSAYLLLWDLKEWVQSISLPFSLPASDLHLRQW